MKTLLALLLVGTGIGCANKDMNGLFDIDPQNARSIVLAEADAEAGIPGITTKIVIDGVAYVRRGACTAAELGMFKVANRL